MFGCVSNVIIHNVENIFRTKNNKNIDEYNKNISAYSFLISGTFAICKRFAFRSYILDTFMYIIHR